MHPVIQFLSHVFGGGQPQAKQQQGSMPDHGPIGPPSGFISPVNNGLVNPVHQGINPLDLRNQQQPQMDPRQVAMHHIANMMNSYNQLQHMVAQPMKPEMIPQQEAQTLNQAPGYQTYDPSGGPQQVQLAQGGVQGSAPNIQNQAPLYGQPQLQRQR